MKSITNRIFLFAAAALSLGTVAYGQTTLKADVPFAFQTAPGPAAAGRYTVQLQDNGGQKIVHINNRETGHNVLSLTYRVDDKANKANKAIAPHLVFRCAESGCQLSEVWTFEGGYGIPVRHVRGPEYLASIKLAGFQN
jgi:hypothetical protein